MIDKVVEEIYKLLLIDPSDVNDKDEVEQLKNIINNYVNYRLSNENFGYT